MIGCYSRYIMMYRYNVAFLTLVRMFRMRIFNILVIYMTSCRENWDKVIDFNMQRFLVLVFSLRARLKPKIDFLNVRLIHIFISI